jgi:hypothetical protein
METPIELPVIMSVKACVIKPNSKDVYNVIPDTNYPDEDIFDKMNEYLETLGIKEDFDCNFITEYYKEGKTLEIYVAWGNREIEPNKHMNKAMRNYFETNEAFDVYGPCIVFALYDDIPVHFTSRDFNSLFFNQ